MANKDDPRYRTWKHMKARCYCVTDQKYKNYGARGIRVCDQWKDDFIQFTLDMGPKPTKDHSIDRIDVNGNYEPSNCRWATPEEQSNNKTDTRYVEYLGERLCVEDWVKKTGIKSATIRARLDRYGWTVGQALGFEPEPEREFKPLGPRDPEKIQHTVFAEYKGETKPLKIWADELGIKYNTLFNRIHVLGMSVEQAFETPLGEKTNQAMATYRGETKPLKVWAVELGMKYTILYNRIKRGWSVEKSFETPV